MSAPQTDLPLNRDEWPNLSSIDGRARFTDGELATPLVPEEAPSVSMVTRIVAFGLCIAIAYFFVAMAR